MSDEKPEIQLFIKSSTIDREQKGSCPLCQQWFMAACILTEQGILSFHVTIVDAESPPKEFKDLSQSKIFPVVKGIRGLDKRGQDIGDKLADDHERLEEFFESFGCPDLKRDGAVQKHFDDLYKFFNLYLQNPNDNGEKLTQKLEKLNAFLESEDERYVIKEYLTYGDCYLMPRLQHIKVGARTFNLYLVSGTEQARQRLIHHLEKLNGFLEGEDQIYVIKDSITYGDCYLMPRLHHIKVAAREYGDFEIPQELFYVWRYLYEAYRTDAFQKTCPTDQDIIKHYEMKTKVFKPRKGVPSLQKSTYSFDIPESILETLENQPPRGGDGGEDGGVYEDYTAANMAASRHVEEHDGDHVYNDATDDHTAGSNAANNSFQDETPEEAIYDDPDLPPPPEAPVTDSATNGTPDRVPSPEPLRSASPEPIQAASPARSGSPAEAGPATEPLYTPPSPEPTYENTEPTYENPEEHNLPDLPPPPVDEENEYIIADRESSVEGSGTPEPDYDPAMGASEGKTSAEDEDEVPAPDYDRPSTPEPSSTPTPDYDAVPTPTPTPTPDYDKTPDDDKTPANETEPKTTSPEHNDSLTYENVDTTIPQPSANTKSVEFTISDKNEDAEAVEVKVNGTDENNVTNGHK